MPFEMIIKELFNFHDGRTVFAGLVTGQVDRIAPGEYVLRSSTGEQHKLPFEGEPIVRRTDPANSMRSLATAANLPVAPDAIRSGNWRLTSA